MQWTEVGVIDYEYMVKYCTYCRSNCDLSVNAKDFRQSILQLDYTYIRKPR